MFQRVILFKFVPDADDALVQRHLDELASLQDAIPQIQSYSAGRVVAEDGTTDFDTVHYLTFATLAEIDAYFHHTAHQAFIARNSGLWAKVLALNAEID